MFDEDLLKDDYLGSALVDISTLQLGVSRKLTSVIGCADPQKCLQLFFLLLKGTASSFKPVDPCLFGFFLLPRILLKPPAYR